MEEKTIFDRLNDERFRANVETGFTVVVAIAIIIVANGFISGFTMDLFLSLEPYASGLATGIASSLVLNNMINRGFYDELLENEDITKTLNSINDKDKQIKDYDYAQRWLDKYNEKEYERLCAIEKNNQIRKLNYDIAFKTSRGKDTTKLRNRLLYIKENGVEVKYKQASLLDLLSFENEKELVGSEKLNFKVVDAQRKKLARSKFVWFLASGLVAGIPIVTGKSLLGVVAYVTIFLLMILVNGFRTYTKTRRVTKTTYHASMKYKNDVLEQCINDKASFDTLHVTKEDGAVVIKKESE